MNSLIEMFSGKTTSRTYKTSTFSFVLRTLTTDELADVLRRTDIVALSDLTKMVMTRKLTLAYALESINGVDILALPEIQELKKIKNDQSLTKVDLLSELLGKFDELTIRKLYSLYEELSADHEKEIIELKKD